MSDSKINMNNFEDILESLTEKKLRVCVVGIGRIGLPTALSFAKSGYYFMNRIDSIDIDDKQDYELAKFLSKKYLKIRK